MPHSGFTGLRSAWPQALFFHWRRGPNPRRVLTLMPHSGFTGLRSAWPQALFFHWRRGPNPRRVLTLMPHSGVTGLRSAWPQALLFQKFLHALAFVGFASIQVAARVDRHAADAVELSGIAAAAADRRAGRLQRAAVDDDDFLVVAVGDEQVALLRVVRERHVPHRAVAGRRLRDDAFLDELAVLLEDLDAVVLPIADVDEVVLRQLHAARRAELLRRRRVRIVRPGIGVSR